VASLENFEGDRSVFPRRCRPDIFLSLTVSRIEFRVARWQLPGEPLSGNTENSKCTLTGNLGFERKIDVPEYGHGSHVLDFAMAQQSYRISFVLIVIGDIKTREISFRSEC
jgi:hypothetical protein